MTIKPIPYVVIDNVEMPVTVEADDIVVLDNLNINWGRENYLDSATPAQLSLTILDRHGDWARSQELLGLEIKVGIRYTNESSAKKDIKIFRGRITEAECIINNTDTETGTLMGFTVNIRAADKLAELGNRFFSNQNIGAQYYNERVTYIMAGSNVSDVIAGIGGDYGSFITFQPKKFDQMSALELIEESMAAAGDFVSYNPDTNRVEASGRVEVATAGLELQLQSDGKFGIRLIGAGESNVIDSGAFIATSGIKRTIGTGITEVRYEYYVNDGSGTYVKATKVLSTGLSESKYGRRTYTIPTENRTNVDFYADVYLDNAKDANTWEPPSFIWDTRRTDGFAMERHVLNFISGTEYRNSFFFQRNSYNPFPSKLPVYRVIGGNIQFAGTRSGKMGWVVEPKLGPVTFGSSYTPLKWTTINPSSATNAVSWNELDDSVTWDDISRVGKGI